MGLVNDVLFKQNFHLSISFQKIYRCKFIMRWPGTPALFIDLIQRQNVSQLQKPYKK